MTKLNERDPSAMDLPAVSRVGDELQRSADRFEGDAIDLSPKEISTIERDAFAAAKDREGPAAEF